MAIDHSTVDQLLAVGGVASPIIGSIMVYFLARMYRNRDGHEQEIAKQGDRINALVTEIRNLQQRLNVRPFDHKWDR